MPGKNVLSAAQPTAADRRKSWLPLSRVFEDLKATIAEMRQSREAQEDSAENLRAQVEAMRLQSRVQALNTLINVPLQVDSNTFLSGFSQQSVPLRDGFQENLEELIKLEQELRIGKQ